MLAASSSEEEEDEERTERVAGWQIELVEEEEVPLWVTLGLYSPRELNVGHYEGASISSSSSFTLGLYSPHELSVGLDAGQRDGKF